ncbi:MULTISPECIES: hypothetical protein [unclassified Marinimicrobium]|uniref:hypothetical protein n=1 Tax=unclassified Marinimicrobium TaxID=2632100 RepID=UPI003BB91617
MASCASSPPRGPEPPRPLPAALLVQCPPPSGTTDRHPDAVALVLKQVYDEYAVCAGRLSDLIQKIHEREAQPP